MINRTEIKAAAKKLIKPAYWSNVAAGLLLTVTTGAVAVFASSHFSQARPEDISKLENLISTLKPEVLLATVGIGVGLGIVLALLFAFIHELITLPLEVGCRGYFLRHREGESSMTECLSGYTGNFKNVFFTMLIRDIKINLWALLFIVPGIVKHYEYKMVPYLLAQNPDMDRKAAFAISRSMMNGHKMDAFKLDLSFIGWDILGAFTFGLTNLFYKNPYQAAADAEFFKTVCAAA